MYRPVLYFKCLLAEQAQYKISLFHRFTKAVRDVLRTIIDDGFFMPFFGMWQDNIRIKIPLSLRSRKERGKCVSKEL